MKKIIKTNPSFYQIGIIGICIIGGLFFSCSKTPGSGGQASIIGKIKTQNYINNCTQLQATYPGADEDVYIIYGDEPSYGERVRTAPDGTFLFRYLRKGVYTVYIYSDDCDEPSGTIAIKKSIEITGRKEQADAGELIIKR